MISIASTVRTDLARFVELLDRLPDSFKESGTVFDGGLVSCV
jgi:hypothetical protein